jgi:hypothetical protein
LFSLFLSLSSRVKRVNQRRRYHIPLPTTDYLKFKQSVALSHSSSC